MSSTVRATALLLIVHLSSLILALTCLASTVVKKARRATSLQLATALGEDVLVCLGYSILAWLATARAPRACSWPFDLVAGLVATSVFSGAALIGAGDRCDIRTPAVRLHVSSALGGCCVLAARFEAPVVRLHARRPPLRPIRCQKLGARIPLASVVTLADTVYVLHVGEYLPLSTLTMTLGSQGEATLRTVRSKVPLDWMVAGTVLAYFGLLAAATRVLLRTKPWERWPWCGPRFGVNPRWDSAARLVAVDRSGRPACNLCCHPRGRNVAIACVATAAICVYVLDPFHSSGHTLSCDAHLRQPPSNTLARLTLELGRELVRVAAARFEPLAYRTPIWSQVPSTTELRSEGWAFRIPLATEAQRHARRVDSSAACILEKEVEEVRQTSVGRRACHA